MPHEQFGDPRGGCLRHWLKLDSFDYGLPCSAPRLSSNAAELPSLGKYGVLKLEEAAAHILHSALTPVFAPELEAWPSESFDTVIETRSEILTSSLLPC